jgi:hypothetical protein
MISNPQTLHEPKQRKLRENITGHMRMGKVQVTKDAMALLTKGRVGGIL